MSLKETHFLVTMLHHKRGLPTNQSLTFIIYFSPLTLWLIPTNTVGIKELITDHHIWNQEIILLHGQIVMDYAGFPLSLVKAGTASFTGCLESTLTSSSGSYSVRILILPSSPFSSFNKIGYGCT